MKTRRYCFIVNPIAGTKSKVDVVKQIDLLFNSYNYVIRYTKRAGHATTLAQEALGKFDVVVAVGGDGTVNEVSKGLLHSDCTLGIVPMGSGNGLARHLGVPMNLGKALRFIESADSYLIDTCSLNGESYNITAGVGFESDIAYLFAQQKGRGLFNYVKSILQSVFSYTSKQYDFELDGEKYSRKAFTVSVANANQYGNNTYINPIADLRDGVFEVCLIKPFGILGVFSVLAKMFTKKLDQSKYYEVLQGTKLTIEAKSLPTVHMDGEPVCNTSDRLEILIVPNSLRVLGV